MEVLHCHGRVAGLRWVKAWHDIDGRPHQVTRYWLPRWLHRLAEWRARCPGGDECHARHKAEHAAYRQRTGLEPFDWEGTDL